MVPWQDFVAVVVFMGESSWTQENKGHVDIGHPGTAGRYPIPASGDYTAVLDERYGEKAIPMWELAGQPRPGSWD